MTEALRRQSSTADSERKYQLISRATIRLFAESRGLDVADDSIRVLAEDVNYRLREIVSEAAKYMRQTPRQYLTTEDINHAAKDSNVELLDDTSPSDRLRFIPLKEQKLFTSHNATLDLQMYVESETSSSDIQTTSQIQNSSDWLEAGSGPDPVRDVDKKCISDYFTSITQCVSGEDSSLRQIALADLICNTKVSHIQDQMLFFVSRWVAACIKSGSSVRNALEVLDAYTNNKVVIYHKQHQMDVLVDILIDKVCMVSWHPCVSTQQYDQQYALNIMSKCLRKDMTVCQLTMQNLIVRCKTILADYLNENESCIAGAVLTLTTLQPKALAEAEGFWQEYLGRDTTDSHHLFVTSLFMDASNKLTQLKSISINPQHHQFLSAVRDNHSSLSVCRLTSMNMNTKSETQRKVKHLHRKLPGRSCVKKLQSLNEWFEERSTLRTRRDDIHIEYGTPSNALKKQNLHLGINYYDSSLPSRQAKQDSDKAARLYILWSKKRKDRLRKYRIVTQSSDNVMNIQL